MHQDSLECEGQDRHLSWSEDSVFCSPSRASHYHTLLPYKNNRSNPTRARGMDCSLLLQLLYGGFVTTDSYVQSLVHVWYNSTRWDGIAASLSPEGFSHWLKNYSLIHEFELLPDSWVWITFISPPLSLSWGDRIISRKFTSHGSHYSRTISTDFRHPKVNSLTANDWWGDKIRISIGRGDQSLTTPHRKGSSLGCSKSSWILIMLSQNGRTVTSTGCGCHPVFQGKGSTLGLYSRRRRRLMGIGIPMINLRRSDDCLRFILGIPILIRGRLRSE